MIDGHCSRRELQFTPRLRRKRGGEGGAGEPRELKGDLKAWTGDGR